MVVHHKEVINMQEYYSKHYISGRDLNTRREERQRQGLCFYSFTQTFNGKLKKKNLSSLSLLLYPPFLSKFQA